MVVQEQLHVCHNGIAIIYTVIIALKYKSIHLETI